MIAKLENTHNHARIQKVLPDDVHLRQRFFFSKKMRERGPNATKSEFSSAHWRNVFKWAFHRWVDDGQTFGISQLFDFLVDTDQFCEETLHFCNFSERREGGVRTPYHPSGSANYNIAQQHKEQTQSPYKFKTNNKQPKKTDLFAIPYLNWKGLL